MATKSLFPFMISASSSREYIDDANLGMQYQQYLGREVDIRYYVVRVWLRLVGKYYIARYIIRREARGFVYNVCIPQQQYQYTTVRWQSRTFSSALPKCGNGNWSSWYQCIRSIVLHTIMYYLLADQCSPLFISLLFSQSIESPTYVCSTPVQ